MRLLIALTGYLFCSIFESNAQSDSKDAPAYLLLNTQVQMESTDAVNAMYNFKFDKADVEFRWFKLKYPRHPLPYFLIGLMEWWKIMPNTDDTQYDDRFMAYMDTAIIYGEKMLDKDESNAEAAFFLAGAYGFKGRLYSDRKQWTKAAFAGKNALKYLEKFKDQQDLSPEFMFGDALFNYYSVWIPENYPWLKFILTFFPKGDKAKGLKQLREVSLNAFYTRIEAQLFLARIYANEEEKADQAYPFAQYLAQTFPDNPYFQRFHARMAYTRGYWQEAEKTSLEILTKIDANMPGYEATGGRHASFFLGYINRFYKQDLNLAKQYFKQAVAFSEQGKAYETGYYHYSLQYLMRMAQDANAPEEAKVYAEKLVKHAPKDHDANKEAKLYLKTKKKADRKEKRKRFFERF